MNVLSLFDGMGCAYLAFKRVGIGIEKYYASEIDKYAKAVAKYNISEYIDLGDITKIDFSKLKDIDFIIGGSPCQDLSIAKKGREGLKGTRSSLFYKFVEALEIIKPKYYILELYTIYKRWMEHGCILTYYRIYYRSSYCCGCYGIWDEKTIRYSTSI